MTARLRWFLIIGLSLGTAVIAATFFIPRFSPVALAIDQTHIDASNETSSSTGSTRSDDGGVDIHRILLLDQTTHPLGAKVCAALETHLRATPGVQHVMTAATPGSRKPGLIIFVTNSTISQKDTFTTRTLEAKFHLTMTTSLTPMLFSSGHGDFKTMSLRNTCTVTHRSTSQGDDRGSQTYRLTAKSISEALAQQLDKTLTDLRKNNAVASVLLDQYTAAFIPPADIAPLLKRSGNPTLAFADIAEHCAAGFSWKAAADPWTEMDAILGELVADGWKSSGRNPATRPAPATITSQILAILKRDDRRLTIEWHEGMFRADYRHGLSDTEEAAFRQRLLDGQEFDLATRLFHRYNESQQAQILKTFESLPALTARQTRLIVQYTAKHDPQRALARFKRLLVEEMIAPSNTRNYDDLRKLLKFDEDKKWRPTMAELTALGIPELADKAPLTANVGISQPFICYVRLPKDSLWLLVRTSIEPPVAPKSPGSYDGLIALAHSPENGGSVSSRDHNGVAETGEIRIDSNDTTVGVTFKKVAGTPPRWEIEVSTYQLFPTPVGP